MIHNHKTHEKETKSDEKKRHEDHKIKHESAEAAEQQQWRKHPGGG